MTERNVPLVGDLAPPRSISPTSASTWQQCELRYALAYGYGWQEAGTFPQLVGNAVHRTVELLYGRPPGERTRGAGSELLRVAVPEELARDEFAALRARTDGLAQQLLRVGEEALDGLFALEDPARVSVDPGGLEVWVSAELYGAPVRGRIDRVYDAGGAYVVADYKSGKVPAPRYTERAFFGLWTYAAALAAADPDHLLPDRVELLYLVGRTRLARPVLRDTLLAQARLLGRVWRQIGRAVAERVVVARTSVLCDWCAFQAACPARAGGALPPVGSAEHAALLAADGLRRRDRDRVAVALERSVGPGEDDAGMPRAPEESQ